MIRFILKLFHQRKERAAHSFDLEEKRTALRRDLAAIQEKAAALADEMKSLRTSMTLPPHPGTPSKGMSSRVLRQARKKREKPETSDADKKHLDKIILEASMKRGDTYAFTTTFCHTQCSEELMELILEMYRDQHKKKQLEAVKDALKGKVDREEVDTVPQVAVVAAHAVAVAIDEIKRHRTSMTVPPPHPFESPSKGMRVRLARQAKRKLYEAETPARRRRLCMIILGALMKQSPFYDGILMIHHKSDSEQVLEMIEEIKEIWEDEGIVGNE
mmetsp:Transcript_27424/g.60918  ORF Transcript_27424/g.60918 Transcript_27424/m.60918 type:complete len:273 (-) Transcript_27424:58-876(-)